jgi:hypothetical protein
MSDPGTRDAQSGLITVRTYATAAMAELDRGVLAEHGIGSVVATGDLSAFSPAGQATLSVHRDNRAAALALLTPEVGEVEDEPRVHCPFCGSERITMVRPFALAALIPIVLPLLFIRRHGCGACGRMWK